MSRSNALSLVLVLPLAACEPAPDAASRPALYRDEHVVVEDRDADTGGDVLNVPDVPVGCTASMPEPVTVDDPDAGVLAHLGRAPRRLDIDQFRASLENTLGARWTGPQTVFTPEAPGGTRFEPQADLLEFFAATLGRPNYVTSTQEPIDPSITFAKLAADAARSVCAETLRRDYLRAPAARAVLLEATGEETLPQGEAAVRRNLAALAIKLWAVEAEPDSETVSGLLGVFRVATAQTGARPIDGWRAVCLDMTTDPRFLTY